MTVRKPGLNEMVRSISAVADRLYSVECARKKAGFKPDPAQLRMVEALDEAGNLLARIIPVVGEVSRSVKPVTIQPIQRDELG